jgi:tripartite-type tricarboxylate transporter receptor subunit TctC
MMSNSKKVKNTGLDWINMSLLDERLKDWVPNLKAQGYSDDYVMGFFAGNFMAGGVPAPIMSMKMKKISKLLGHDPHDKTNVKKEKK